MVDRTETRRDSKKTYHIKREKRREFEENHEHLRPKGTLHIEKGISHTFSMGLEFSKCASQEVP